MDTEKLLEQFSCWHQAEEHQKIVDAVLSIPEAERNDDLLGQLVVAYNNLEEYDAAIAVLEQLRPRQENTDKWQYRMGYALYYLDRNREAKIAFSRSLLLNGSGNYTEDCRDFLEMIEQEHSSENEQKDESVNGKQDGPEVYTEAQLDAVEAHIAQYFGDYPNVFHEIVSPDIHVDICVIPPHGEKEYYTLVTMGMGAHRMNVPAELAEHKLERAELVIALPPDWKIGENGEVWYWPLRVLKQLARLPGECDTWLGWGHTVDNQDPYAENTQLCGSILLGPVDAEDGAQVCPLSDNEEVNFYQVLPLYREEMEYKQENDAETLFEQMEELPFVVDPNRPNCCEDEEDVYDTLMDRAKYHLESLREKQLPLEEITAYNHLAIYLRWCIEQGLMSDLFAQQLPELMEDVQSGKRSLDLREQLRDREELNHALIRTYFNKEGAAFADYYYSGEDESAPYYPSDVDGYAEGYFGKKRYHSKEFQDEAYLSVPYDEAYYQGMKQILDRRYQAWTELRDQLAENTKASQLAQAMMSYLDCPCRYFAPTLDDNEIFAAYHEAAERGKQEGFVPLLVAEDETLWECLIMNSDEDSEGDEDYGFDAEAVAATRKKLLQASLPQGEQVVNLLLKTRLEEASEDDIDWDEEVLGEIAGGEPSNRFIGYWGYGTRATLPLILAEIPVKNPWEIFAYLPFGGWNDCPDTPELMAVTKYWFQQHGAVPAVMTHDVLEFALSAPVEQEHAMRLALEQYAWCPDIVDQSEDITVGTLAHILTQSKFWYFWWD